MKNILYFVPEFPVLSETFIEREITKLIEFGNLAIKVLSIKKASGFISPNTAKVTYFKSLNFIYLVKGLLYLFSEAKKRGVFQALGLILKDSSKSLISRLYLFVKSLGYAVLFSEFKPDHIHVHFLSDSSTIVMGVSKILNVPFSVSGHARDVFINGTLLKEKVENAAFVSICNTYAFQKCLENSQKNSKNVHKIFHGIDLKLFNELPRAKDVIDVPKLLTVSRLVEKKGLDYLIEAMVILRNRGCKFELSIVGYGPMYNSLNTLIIKSDLVTYARILGGGNGLPNKEVIEILKTIDIYIHSGIQTAAGDVDGVPTAIIEAGMVGLPVVATNVGSVGDLINGDTGILVSQKNAVELADSIEKLIKDPELRHALGANLKQKTQEMFDLDKNARELEKLLLKSI